jgi:hypothetical protein
MSTSLEDLEGTAEPPHGATPKSQQQHPSDLQRLLDNFCTKFNYSLRILKIGFSANQDGPGLLSLAQCTEPQELLITAHHHIINFSLRYSNYGAAALLLRRGFVHTSCPFHKTPSDSSEIRGLESIVLAVLPPPQFCLFRSEKGNKLFA